MYNWIVKINSSWIFFSGCTLARQTYPGDALRSTSCFLATLMNAHHYIFVQIFSKAGHLPFLIVYRYFVTKIVRKNCSSDWEKLSKFEAEGRELEKFWDH